ncbi:hypothetical protein EVAR_29875_1 [Eumeta japonica]|uniref:Uncharacterized protein n=1 Tax=Eumeta variegata TaxID=151549 RepID=A0A4C1V7G0_EUMVA|nr:hypothetical protein EVAR_29875_1 [Eumeta japonica]
MQQQRRLLQLQQQHQQPTDSRTLGRLPEGRVKRSQQTGDLPYSIKRRLRHKRRIHKLWTRTRCPKLKKELNDLSRKISEAVRDFLGVTWEATIDRAVHPESAYHFFTITRALRTGGEAYEEVHGHSTPSFPGDLFITPAALHKIVKCLPKKKVSKPDGISAAALRHLPRRAIVAMNRVFNGIIRTAHESTAPPSIQKELRVIYGDDILRYGESLRQGVARWPHPQATKHLTAACTHKNLHQFSLTTEFLRCHRRLAIRSTPNTSRSITGQLVIS